MSTCDDYDDISILSDCEESLQDGFTPRIESTTSLPFGVFKNISKSKNKQLFEDLEIVEEVIRDVMPGKRSQSNSQSPQMPYRQKKMGFNWIKCKQEYREVDERFTGIPSPPSLGEEDEEESLPPFIGEVEENSALLSEEVEENSAPLSEDGERSLPPLGEEGEENSAPLSEIWSPPPLSEEDEESHSPLLSEDGEEDISVVAVVNAQKQDKSPKRRSFAAMRASGVVPQKKRRKWEVSSIGEPTSPSVSEKGKSKSKAIPSSVSSEASGLDDRGSPSASTLVSSEAFSLDDDNRGSPIASSSSSDEEDDEDTEKERKKSKSAPSRGTSGNQKNKSSSTDARPIAEQSSDEEDSAVAEKETDQADKPSKRKTRSSIQNQKILDLPPVTSDSENGSSVASDEEDGKESENERNCVRRSKRCNLISNRDFGRLVWGKSPNSRPWPAVIISSDQCKENPPAEDRVLLIWFGDYRITEVALHKVMDFVKHFSTQFAQICNYAYNLAVYQCLKECRERSGLEAFTARSQYINWGRNGMEGIGRIFPTKEEDWCSPLIRRCLSRYKRMRRRENSFYNPHEKVELLKAVSDSKYDIEKVCIACDRVGCEVDAPHPYFEGGTCSACKDEFEDLTSYLTDGTEVYCTVCGSPGDMIVCDKNECTKTYCYACIELLVSPKALKTIKDTDPWFCFLCVPYKKKTHGHLKPRPDWAERLAASQSKKDKEDIPEVEDETPDISTFPQRPLRVLSLFDGIATGLYVLSKLGLEVEVYYASEILDDAKNVAKVNHNSKITHIGDVQTVTDKDIKKMCPIDLLIGGSPCNDLSFVNPNRKGLYDPTGTGILFFHYLRALKTIQLHNKDTNTHLFWLFENVVNMPREFKNHISIFLQREPWVLNSKNFSPQNRPRCYWGNIPDMYKPLPPEVLKKTYLLEDYITKLDQRSALEDTVNCITTKSNSIRPVVQMNDSADTPWITEIERIFGFPTHYTDVGNLSNLQRQAVLGRSWTVGVIEYILKPLRRYFPSSRKKQNRVEEEDQTD